MADLRGIIAFSVMGRHLPLVTLFGLVFLPMAKELPSLLRVYY